MLYLVLSVMALTVMAGGNWRRTAQVQAMLHRGKGHLDFATTVHKDFQTRYPWANWFVLSYEPVTGFDKHYVGGTNVYYQFRSYGRNFMIGYTSKTAKFDQKKASSSIHDIKCYFAENTCKRDAAKRIYDSIRNVGTARAVLYKRYHGRVVKGACYAYRNHVVTKEISFSKTGMPKRDYSVIVFG